MLLDQCKSVVMKICVLVGFLLVASVAATPLRFDHQGETNKILYVYTLRKYPINFTAPLLGVDLPEIIPDEYIVVFEPIDRVSSEQGVEKLARDNAS